jgi:hypothetical protein
MQKIKIIIKFEFIFPLDLSLYCLSRRKILVQNLKFNSVNVGQTITKSEDIKKEKSLNQSKQSKPLMKIEIY